MCLRGVGGGRVYIGGPGSILAERGVNCFLRGLFDFGGGEGDRGWEEMG